MTGPQRDVDWHQHTVVSCRHDDWFAVVEGPPPTGDPPAVYAEHWNAAHAHAAEALPDLQPVRLQLTPGAPDG